MTKSQYEIMCCTCRLSELGEGGKPPNKLLQNHINIVRVPIPIYVYTNSSPPQHFQFITIYEFWLSKKFELYLTMTSVTYRHYFK